MIQSWQKNINLLVARAGSYKIKEDICRGLMFIEKKMHSKRFYKYYLKNFTVFKRK